MFDFAWTEIALIGVVALIAIGPKDMPVAIKAVADMIKKARRMAGEFQTHVDEMVREANLDEVRSQINEIRSLDVKGMVERAIDSDGSLRGTLATNPLATPYKSPTPPAIPVADSETRVLERPAGVDPSHGPEPAFSEPVESGPAPSFIPPASARVEAAPMTPVVSPAPPAFIPPSAAKPAAALGGPDPKPSA
jgi:sec-independent protein translocase protein TatB